MPLVRLVRRQNLYRGFEEFKPDAEHIQLRLYSTAVGISFNSAIHSSDCFCHASHIGPL